MSGRKAGSGTKAAKAARPAKRSQASARRSRRRVGWALLSLVAVLTASVTVALVSPELLPQRLRAWVPGQLVRFVVVEGADLYQIARSLEEHGICASGEFEAATRDPRLLRELEVDADSAEGYLAPATYELFRGLPAREVVSKMVARRRRDLAPLAADGLPRPLGSVHEALILASLIEREARVPSERPMMARVFLNRLLDPGGETKGRLQSDPSAVYGCVVFGPTLPGCEALSVDSASRKVTPAMLRASQNPYNTYRHAGLPPGPIGNPGRAALEAALHPAEGDALYFVADGRGGHVFSASFAEHRRVLARRQAAFSDPLPESTSDAPP